MLTFENFQCSLPNTIKHISENSPGTTQTRQSINTPWVQLTLDNQQTFFRYLIIKKSVTTFRKLKITFWVDGTFGDYIRSDNLHQVQYSMDNE